MTGTGHVGRKRRRRVLVLVAATPLLVVGCSSSEPDGESASAGSTGPVVVTSDVRFADASPDLAPWSDPVLDVYAPQGARDLPLIVMFPPHSLTKGNTSTVQLAKSIAQRGAVVVVANWSQLDDPPETLQNPAAFTAIARAGQSLAGCAVAFATSRAADFGADQSRLVLVGELYGANTASMVALGTPEPYPGCKATTTGHSAIALVGVNGDWLATFPMFDAVAAAAVTAYSPWALLDRAPKIDTKLVVTPAAATVSQRCADQGTGWMAARDPTGAMREQLKAVGAYADGCVDFGDQAEAMAAQMSAQGQAAEVVRLANPDGATSSGPGGQVLTYGQADLTLLVDTVMDATQAPVR